LTVSAARRLWGGRSRAQACLTLVTCRAAGRALTLAVCAARHLREGVARGARGMCPRSICGLCPPLLAPTKAAPRAALPHRAQTTNDPEEHFALGLDTGRLGRSARAVCAGRAAGRALTLSFVRSAQYEVGARGSGGCAPGAKCGLCPPRGVCLTDVAVGKACRLRELFGLVWPGRA